ncbi:MAG: GNAT family N-acetyltransferase [Ancrocorticia sp.]
MNSKEHASSAERLADLGLRLAVPRPGWASRIAAFDLLAFGADAWPVAVWAHELAGENASYLSLVPAEPGIAAVPEIVAIGGVSQGIDAEILTIAVASAHRGLGLGGLLLDELLAVADEQGSESVFLEVRSRDGVAQSLYEGRGFEEVGRRPRYYHDDDALIMRRDRPAV